MILWVDDKMGQGVPVGVAASAVRPVKAVAAPRPSPATHAIASHGAGRTSPATPVEVDASKRQVFP